MHYFISDIHLGILEREADKHRESLLLDFLDKIKEDAKSLYIVGDLFDYWFEYKSVIPKYYYKVLAKLAEINKFGIDIIYLMGNHDFGHFDFFEKSLKLFYHLKNSCSYWNFSIIPSDYDLKNLRTFFLIWEHFYHKRSLD